jgi:hypothetical protein
MNDSVRYITPTKKVSRYTIGYYLMPAVSIVTIMQLIRAV